MEMVTGIIDKMTGWVDNLFKFFSVYTAGYSKLLVYALLIFVGAKMLKVKLDVNVGKK